MQLAVIEIRKKSIGLKNASSSEFNKKNSKNIIGLITEWFKGSKFIKETNTLIMEAQ